MTQICEAGISSYSSLTTTCHSILNAEADVNIQLSFIKEIYKKCKIMLLFSMIVWRGNFIIFH